MPRAPRPAFQRASTALRAGPTKGLLAWFSRYGLLILAGLGALLLAAAEFATLYEVRAITAVVPGGTTTSGSHHGYALLIVALVALPMAWGAVVGGSRPATIAVIALGALALFVCLAIDLPDVGDEGLLAETYEQAKASPQEGFYLETLGSVVLLLAGVGMLVLRPAAAAAAAAADEARPAEGETGEPEPAPAG